MARALDAGAATGLAGGWRVYALNQPLSLARARALLAGEPAADAVHLDLRLHPMDVPDDPLYGSQWALPKIGAPAAGTRRRRGPRDRRGHRHGHRHDPPRPLGPPVDEPGEIPGNNVNDDGDGLKDDVHGWNFADENAQLYSAADNETHGTHVAGRSRRSATTPWAWPAWPTTRASWR